MMQNIRLRMVSTAFGLFLALPQTALAAQHLWDISEIYSNADGSVQFIEMATSSNGQNLLSTHMIIANSDGNVTNFVIPTNTPNSNTSNQRLLFATPGFADIPGAVAPDYTLPAAPFFDPDADSLSISFAASSGSPFDVVNFSGSDLPNNGLDSLNPDLSSGRNTPTNFTGAMGRVDLAGPSVDPCDPTPTTLCLNNNRFKVEVAWSTDSSTPGSITDFSAGGVARNTPVSDVWTGMWFFDPDNLDLLIHIFQGCDFGGNYWVFAAGLTDVGVTLTVTDTQNGEVRSYDNPLGSPFQPIQDTSAFATCPKSRAEASPATKTPHPEQPAVQPLGGGCVADATTVCLHDGRFRVTVDTPGAASPAQELADGTAGFPFTSPTFFDLFVSITDASSSSGQYWVTYSMFNPSDFTLTVTDTVLSQTQVYNHTAADPLFVQDQTAFAGDEVITIDGTFSGSWFAPVRNGEGFIFDVTEVNGVPHLVLYYFTYENNDSGRQAWLVGPAPIIGNKASVPVLIADGAQFGEQFDAADVNRTDWGNIKVTALSCDLVMIESNSTLFPAISYVATRLTPAPTGVEGACQASVKSQAPVAATKGIEIDGGYSGSWFVQARDGEGFIFNIAEIGGVNTLVVFYFTYENDGSGRQAWVVGSAPIIGNVADVPMVINSGAQFGDAFDAADVVETPWGNVKVSWQSCDLATVEVTSSFGDISFDISRVTLPTIGATGTCAP